MPELPEVQTMVNDLKKKVLNRTFLNVWTDSEKIIKKPKKFSDFKRQIKGKKILKVWRRAKNILIELSGNNILLIHNKMTGHLLLGKWTKKGDYWEPVSGKWLKDRVNSYIHLIFWLSGDVMLALSDLRKFAKVELWNKTDLFSSKDFKDIGPEPLESSFTFKRFRGIIEKTNGKIKKVLMDPKVIAGIGNIYSDEILWWSKVHPLKRSSNLTEKELESIYKNIKKVLSQAVKLRGESFADFRDLEGKKGFFDDERVAYQREGEKCIRCKSIMRRIKIGGRSACYCPNCQKI